MSFYLSKELLLLALEGFKSLAQDGEVKQGVTQDVSAIRHCLALDRVLKKNNADSVRLKHKTDPFLQEFIKFVGDIVKLNEAGRYTTNLINDIKEKVDFGVGSNLISAGVATHSTQDIQIYPKKSNKGLIIIDNYNFSLSDDYIDTLENIYKLPQVRFSFLIWLNRFNTFDEVDNEPQALYKQLKANVEEDYSRELSKLIVFSDSKEFTKYLMGLDSLLSHVKTNLEELFISATEKRVEPKKSISSQNLQKPFLLLAGISGTGKTRFVREQAFDDLSNYQLVSVRPDWHEPSDLLGYVSRISGEEKYVTTDVLKFIAKAWRELIDSGVDISSTINNGDDTKTTIEGSSEDLEQIPPFWLCLDEMNLAPVEQYFADYLSVSETRKWSWQDDKFEYCCDPLLTSSTINDLFDKGDSLREALELTDSSYDELWSLFETKGIAIPFNLMVAGTVNMDETTHGFSRKVIDRALSFDFGEFFPNDFQKFFEPDTVNLKLSYPVWSDGRDLEALADTIDVDGSRTVNFLDTVNKSLVGTPFQLAFRALNEILLSVIANKPQTERELMAVWDDFVMCKLLPRIEGDNDKLSSSQDDSEETILKSLLVVLEGELGQIWQGKSRPDLYREYTVEKKHPKSAPQENSPSKMVWIPCRSKHKLKRMQERLDKYTFTSFWP